MKEPRLSENPEVTIKGSSPTPENNSNGRLTFSEVMR